MDESNNRTMLQDWHQERDAAQAAEWLNEMGIGVSDEAKQDAKRAEEKPEKAA